MQVASLMITYASGLPAEAFQLEHRVYDVGSAFATFDGEKGQVPLRGRNISPIQFRLIPGALPTQWFIEALGTTSTFLGTRKIDDLEGADRPEIVGNAAITVPDATIQLRVDTGLEQRVARADSYVHWRGLQDEIHDAVVKELQNEGHGKHEDRNSPEQRARVLRLLDQKVRAGLDRAGPDAVKSAVATAMRLALYRLIATVSTDPGQVRVHSGPPRHAQLDQRARELATVMDLRLDLDSVESDTDRVDRGFEVAFETLYPNIPVGDRKAVAGGFIATNVWNFIYEFGPVTDLMELDIVTEVMIVGHDRIFIERFGKLEQYGYSFSSEERLRTLLTRVVNDAKRNISESEAIVDFRLRDGSRVNAIIPPLAVNGPNVTIRRHRKDMRWTLDRLVEEGKLTRGMAWFLQAAVVSRRSVVVSGGTGSGKTTLLNALSAFIPEGQRVVTIEDTAELSLRNRHVVTLQSRPANAEGANEVDIRRLVKNALRMRPDRIIVGECRGGEAVDMLQALNTGHAGSMTTAHANGPAEMLSRLEVMVLQGEPNLPVSAIRRQIVDAVDLIVQLNKVEGDKRITEIVEVVDIHPVTGEILIEPIFAFRPSREPGRSRYVFTGHLPSFVEEIERNRPRIPSGPAAGSLVDLADVFESGAVR